MHWMIRRQVLREELLECCVTGLAGFALLIIGPGLVVEVARTFDVGVLEGIGPGAELPGAGLGQRDEI